MAGTDHSRQAASGGPAIILVEPQLGENIGTAARAMANCGLGDLRLVRPRDGWPSDEAVAAASGADIVLDKARLYPDVPAAIADLVHVYAATARDRYMVKRELTPRRAAEEMRGFLAAGDNCGVLRSSSSASRTGRSASPASPNRSKTVSPGRLSAR